MAKPPPVPFFILRGHEVDVTALCFICDEDNTKLIGRNETILLSGSKCGEIFIWNLMTNRIQFQLQSHDGQMIMWLSTYNRNMLSQGRDGFLNIWKFSEDDWIIERTVEATHNGFASIITFTLSSLPYLAHLNTDKNNLSIMDYDTTATVAEITTPAHGMCMCLKAVSSKEDIYLFCGLEDGVISVYSCRTNLLISTFQCQKEPIFCIDIDLQYRQRGVNGSSKDSVKVWQISDDLQMCKFTKIKITNPGISTVAIRADGKIMIAGGWDGSVRVFSWKTLQPLAVMIHQEFISSFAFSEKDINKHKSVFATGSKKGDIALWSIY